MLTHPLVICAILFDPMRSLSSGPEGSRNRHHGQHGHAGRQNGHRLLRPRHSQPDLRQLLLSQARDGEGTDSHTCRSYVLGTSQFAVRDLARWGVVLGAQSEYWIPVVPAGLSCVRCCRRFWGDSPGTIGDRRRRHLVLLGIDPPGVLLYLLRITLTMEAFCVMVQWPFVHLLPIYR